MKYTFLSLILLATSNNVFAQSDAEETKKSNQYRECAAIKMHYMHGKDFNNKRVEELNRTLHIPKGWEVVGTGVDGAPYLFLCR